MVGSYNCRLLGYQPPVSNCGVRHGLVPRAEADPGLVAWRLRAVSVYNRLWKRYRQRRASRRGLRSGKGMMPNKQRSRLRRPSMGTLWPCLLLMIAFVFLAARLGQAGGASPPTQRYAADVSLRRLPARVLPADRPGPRPAAASLLDVPAPYADCIEVVAQYWQDDNWEVYAFAAGGSNLRRLTDSAGWDGAPSLGRLCGYVAFESERDGSLDLYIMDRNGGNLQQLIDEEEGDYWPALSPDGARVAFRRGGDTDYAQAELYLLRLSDRALTRLTDNSAYDDRPTWSPDGSKLAFISDRLEADTDTIWVMNADGSDPQQLLAEPVASSPKWSPSGERLAFAAYPPGVEFGELWVVDADGSDARQVYKAAGATTSARPGGWTFDGRYIIYEEATWTQHTGQWFVTTSEVYMIDPDNPSARYRLSPDGIWMAPAAALCDGVPPTSRVNALPASSTLPFTVSWSGSDACSPTLEFQIQYRRGASGSWQDWAVTPGQSWTTATQASFGLAAPGETVYFRSRARDIAGNIEGWPSGNGDAQTTISSGATLTPTPTASPTPTPAPTRVFVGAVRDVRGVPIPEASARLLPDAQAEARAGPGGYYQLPIPSEGAFHVEVSASGYAAQVLWRPDASALQGAAVYLSAAPELLLNGSFESAGAAWYARGSVSYLEVPWGFCPQPRCFGQNGARVARLGVTAGALGAAEVAWPNYGLWQYVTIPAAMQNPTLSWVYALPEGGSVGTLRALVGPEGAQSQVWSSDRPSAWPRLPNGERYPAWEHGQVDLTPWRGQTVRVEIAYTPGSVGTWALIDAVSLSPWVTPYIERVVPSGVGVGQSANITVYGSNLEPGAQLYLGQRALPSEWSSSNRLQGIVGADMPRGRYDVYVANPSGRRGALVQGFIVGGRLELPLIRRR
ncbi:MAG: PD40 domain-containing protein [Chloroflexi bacterium]|nr:PD40 domain-containing protein [Chloroflexota bacterium]